MLSPRERVVGETLPALGARCPCPLLQAGVNEMKKALLILAIIVLSVFTLFNVGVLAAHFMGSQQLDQVVGLSMYPS
jgi:hypothetical protein